MDIGKILSFISPAAGAVTGQGIGKALPFISPAFGMASGKGPFGEGFGGLGGTMGGAGGGGFDIEALLKMLQGGGQQPPGGNYLNMFGGG